jgi:hypothetical protein
VDIGWRTSEKNPIHLVQQIGDILPSGQWKGKGLRLRTHHNRSRILITKDKIGHFVLLSQHAGIQGQPYPRFRLFW